MQETSSEDIGALGKLLENPSPERGGETGVSALGANAKQHVSVGSTAEFDRAGTSANSTHVSKEESSSRVLGGFFDIHQREPPPVSRWPWSATHGSASGSQSTCPGSDETKNGGEVARDAKEAMQSRTYTSLGGTTREVLRGSGYGAPVKDPLAHDDNDRSSQGIGYVSSTKWRGLSNQDTPLSMDYGARETSSVQRITSDLKHLALSALNGSPLGFADSPEGNTMSSMDVSDLLSVCKHESFQPRSMVIEQQVAQTPQRRESVSYHMDLAVDESSGLQRDRFVQALGSGHSTAPGKELDPVVVQSFGAEPGTHDATERLGKGTRSERISTAFAESLPMPASRPETDTLLHRYDRTDEKAADAREWIRANRSPITDQGSLSVSQSVYQHGNIPRGTRSEAADDALNGSAATQLRSDAFHSSSRVWGSAQPEYPGVEQRVHEVVHTSRRLSALDKTRSTWSEETSRGPRVPAGDPDSFRQEAARLVERIRQLEGDLHRSSKEHPRANPVRGSVAPPERRRCTPETLPVGAIESRAPDVPASSSAHVDDGLAVDHRSTGAEHVASGGVFRETGIGARRDLDSTARERFRETPSHVPNALLSGERPLDEQGLLEAHELRRSPTLSTVDSTPVSVSPLQTPVARQSSIERRSLAASDHASWSQPAPDHSERHHTHVQTSGQEAFSELPRATLRQRLEITLRQLGELQAVVDQQFEVIARLDEERSALQERLADTTAPSTPMRTASTQTEYSKLTASSDDDDDEQPPTAVYWQRKYEQACREYRFYASQKSQALRIAQLRNAKLERLVERLQKQLHEAEADITVARERLTRLRREHQRLRTWVLENGLTLSPLQKLERESPSP